MSRIGNFVARLWFSKGPEPREGLVLSGAGHYLNEAAIVEHIFAGMMAQGSWVSWLTTTRKDLIRCRHSIGARIRSRYGMWADDHPRYDCDDPESQEHPDQASLRVIELVWEKIRKYAVERSGIGECTLTHGVAYPKDDGKPLFRDE